LTPFGVLGGSFDPVHRGHLALAGFALRAFRLSRVLLLPCAQPPHKPGRALAARYHRLEMLYLAAEDRQAVDVATIEIAQDGVHFTVDTLRALRAVSPSRNPVFICGSDALADVASWRDYKSLLAEFDFAAVIRPDDRGEPREPRWPDEVLRRVMPPTADCARLGEGGRVYRLDMPALAVSSSLVRARRTAGLPVEDLVPARVARYIQRHRLYAEEGPR
jgi:nicotinate-nucleotide adenylyltransferase